MTGYVFDIKKFSIHDGPGIRTTVFFKGCSLRCWWCHNPESIKEIGAPKNNSSDTDDLCDSEDILNSVREYSVPELIDVIKKDEIFYDESGGGVTFSGGEPLIQVKFLKEVLQQCKIAGIHTCVDTSGYAPFQSFKKVINYTDLFLYDLKLFNETDHRKYTNVGNAVIFENLRKLLEYGAKVIIRIPLIPGITDTPVNLDASAQLISSINGIERIDLLPYNKLSESKYERFNQDPKLSGLETQNDLELEKAKNYFTRLNIEVLIHG